MQHDLIHDTNLNIFCPFTIRFEKLLTSYDARAGLQFLGFKPPIIAFVPATLPVAIGN
jgi:hypothetical protein